MKPFPALPGEDVLRVLREETLKADAAALGLLMADHTALDWRPLLPRITIPCLNCIGARSGVFPLEGCAAVSALVPRCQQEVFEDCSHWLHLEDPGRFNALLTRFVAGCGAPAAAAAAAGKGGGSGSS